MNFISKNIAIKYPKVNREQKYPIRIKIPSFFNNPNPINDTDQATIKLEKGVGKGRARRRPKIKTSSPLMVWAHG